MNYAFSVYFTEDEDSEDLQMTAQPGRR